MGYPAISSVFVRADDHIRPPADWHLFAAIYCHPEFAVSAKLKDLNGKTVAIDPDPSPYGECQNDLGV